MYNCFSEKGETALPKKEELAWVEKSGVEPTLFLDSCVCLHIIKVVDYGKRATNVDIARVIALKDYLSRVPIKISPLFGLLELCYNNDKLDNNKLWDFKHRIDFYDLISLKEFKKFKYDFESDYYLLDENSIELPNPNDALEPSLKNSYCALLKIRSIAKKDLRKESAVKNVNLFLDWMVDELDNVRGAEYKLALNIFGGNTSFRKMIGLDDCKQSQIKKNVLGTCWDIFHGKNASNSFRLFQMTERNILPFFLTSDANLFKIFKDLSLKLIKDGGDKFSSSFIHNLGSTFPHLNEDFFKEQNRKMMNIFVERRNKAYNFNRDKIERLIQNLEIENQV